MKVLATMRLSLRALSAQRARSLLAAAGVAIGITGVSLTSAIGAGAEAELVRGLATLGTHLLVVRPNQAKRGSEPRALQGVATTLSVDDAEELETVAGVAAVAPAHETMMRVRSQSGALATKVVGTTGAFPSVRGFVIARGRMFDSEEERDAARVVVLGSRVGEHLFAGEDAVGQTIRIRGITFEVIGVFASKGASGSGADSDNQVFVPIATALRRLVNEDYLTTVFVSVADPEQMEAVEQEARTLLFYRHRLGRRDLPDDFAIQNQAKLLESRQKVASLMRLLTLGLAGVSLLVGGTGILALMLLSVRERTGEIGLRMAVGARARDVLAQFLLEATGLAAAGGVIGVFLGTAGAALVRLATEWPVYVSLTSTLLPLGFATMLGLVFGALPARKAARLSPVAALAAE